MHGPESGYTTRHAIDPVSGGIALASALGFMAIVYGSFLAFDAFKRRRDRQNHPGAGE